MSIYLRVFTPLLLLAMAAPARPRQTYIPAPILISPELWAVMDNGCLNQKDPIIWDFDWEDVPGATLYDIKVWRNPDKPVVRHLIEVESQYQDKTTRAYIMNNNLKGWCWTVRAGAKGRWGDWAEIRCFNVEPVNTDCP